MISEWFIKEEVLAGSATAVGETFQAFYNDNVVYTWTVVEIRGHKIHASLGGVRDDN